MVFRKKEIGLNSKKLFGAFVFIILFFWLLFRYVLFPNPNSSILAKEAHWKKLGASIQDNLITFQSGNQCEEARTAVLLHGWLLNSPDYYMNLVSYLQEKGYDVIFPLYQNGVLPYGLRENLLVSLEQIKETKVDILIGHSQGGSLAAAIGTESQAGINPSNILIFTPGDGRDVNGEPLFPSMRVKWDTKPTEPLQDKRNFTVIVGQSDELVGGFVANEIKSFLNTYAKKSQIEMINLENFSNTIADHYFITGGSNISKNPGFIKYASGDEWNSVRSSNFSEELITFLDSLIPDTECLE